MSMNINTKTIVTKLSAKYGFPKEEAMEFLGVKRYKAVNELPIQTAAASIMQTLNITENESELYNKQKSKAKFDTAEEEYEYARQEKKKCSKCNLTKNLTEYSGNTSGCDAFDREGYRLRRPECKICSTEAAKGKNEAKFLAKKIGIPYTAPEGTKCAICGKLSKKGDGLVFDHSHKTNNFRGYLHNSCNRSLGVLGDDVESLIQVLNFLNKSENKKITQDIKTGKITIIED